MEGSEDFVATYCSSDEAQVMGDRRVVNNCVGDHGCDEMVIEYLVDEWGDFFGIIKGK